MHGDCVGEKDKGQSCTYMHTVKERVAQGRAVQDWQGRAGKCLARCG